MATLPKIVYNFNENSTTTIRDYSENGSDGTATGLSLTDSARVGKDAVFTDSTNTINMGNVTYLNGAENACIHLGIDFAANGNTRKVLTKSGQIEIQVLSGTSTLRFTLTDSTASVLDLDATFTTDFADYDLVIIDNDVILYQDGVSVDTGSITGGLATNSNVMYIGYDGSTNSAVFNLNEFKIYNEAVSTDNIAAWIAEQNGIYTDSGVCDFNVGDVIGSLLLEATPLYAVVSWVGSDSDFRFLPLSDNIGGGQEYKRVAHLWDTDRQWGLTITDTPEICFYDGMSKSSEVFSASKKLYCFTKEGVIKTSSTKTANYTVTSSDQRIYVDSSGGAFTITLEASPTTNREIEIIDSTGDCGGNTVTIDGNGKNIIGNSTALMNSDFIAFVLVYNGTQWNLK